MYGDLGIEAQSQCIYMKKKMNFFIYVTIYEEENDEDVLND